MRVPGWRQAIHRKKAVAYEGPDEVIAAAARSIFCAQPHANCVGISRQELPSAHLPSLVKALSLALALHLAAEKQLTSLMIQQ